MFLTRCLAQKLDDLLLSKEVGFSLDQLMELAGLAVASAVCRILDSGSILVCCGPGNNGGDGLVAARHLKMFGYAPHVIFPRRSERFQRLVTQLTAVNVPVYSDLEEYHGKPALIIDAIFGFNFNAPVRTPFNNLLNQINEINSPILSVDVPSGWHVEHGPQDASTIRMPDFLVSLSAPKLCARKITNCRHFVGGRFVPEQIAKQLGIEIPKYVGSEQITEIE